MSVEPSVKPTKPGMPRDLVEQIVYQATERGSAQRIRAHRSPDFGHRCTQLAVLHERQARWWAVLVRYMDPFTPYLRAVLDAQQFATRQAETYRQYAANQAERVARLSAERAA